LASTGNRADRSGSDRFLPPDPRVESPYRFTPQLALRIGILGAVALLAFGVLFFRLWALQVLSGPQYLQAALDNQLRSVRIEAPRGQILDREGRPLVINVPGTAVELHPADLPMTWKARLHELRRLSKIVNVPVNEMLRAGLIGFIVDGALSSVMSSMPSPSASPGLLIENVATR